MSAARAVTALGLILAAVGAGLFAVLIKANGSTRSTWQKLVSRRGLNTFILLAFPAFLAAWVVIPKILITIYQTSGTYTYFAYHQRLLPVFAWLFISMLEMLFGLTFYGGTLRWAALLDDKKLAISFGAAWLAAGLIFLFVSLSGVGLIPDGLEWGQPTVPLMEWQIWLAWAIGAIFACVLIATQKQLDKVHKWQIDLAICVLIYLAAAVAWLSQPLPFTYFAPPGRAPNFEVYPFSDAEVYSHYAQSLVIGEGFMGNDIPSRPLYITFLAGAFLLGGQQYSRIILLQTLGLAFLPVILYLLGKELHSRPAGVVAALLAVFRELTSIQVMPFTDDVSTSKILFADLPTALILALFTLLVVVWLKQPGKKPWLPLLIGGVLGMAVLVRAQSVVLLPVVIVFALFSLWKQRSLWWKQSLVLVLGFVICMAPWMLRNLVLTGRFVFTPQTGAVLATYESSREHRVKDQMGGNVSRYSQVESGEIMQIIRNNPLFVVNFTTSHLVNNEIGNVLVMPIRFDLADWKELVYPSEAFWQKWAGKFSPAQNALLILNLGIISLGLAACWKKMRTAGLFPLLINLGYNLGTSAARFSGLRYLLPVDWAIYFYYAAGLVTITYLALSVAGISLASTEYATGTPEKGGDVSAWNGRWKGALVGSLLILLIGAAPVIVEAAIPERYPQISKAQLLSQLLSMPELNGTGVDQAALKEFASRDDVFLASGRGIYPRFYASGDGEPLTAKQGYEVQDTPRLVFLLASKLNRRMILHLETPPDHFPNASDVLVLGCAKNFKAFIAVVLESSIRVYIDSVPIENWRCEQ
jgi:4-amino-4-deoxy-L-arabinose transferase-like glycosyltransferase